METYTPAQAESTSSGVLPLPDQGILKLELPAFISEVSRLASQTLNLEDAIDVQAQAEGLQQKLRRQRESEDVQRKAGVAACSFARAIGEAMGPAKAGRPGQGEERVLPDLSSDQRKRYRLCAEPTLAEFTAWAQEADTVTMAALARYGQKLRRERDRDTGAPAASLPSAAAPTATSSPATSRSAEAPAEQGSEGEAAPPPPAPRVIVGLVRRMAEDVAAAIEEERGKDTWTELREEQAKQVEHALEGLVSLVDSFSPSAN